MLLWSARRSSLCPSPYFKRGTVRPPVHAPRPTPHAAGFPDCRQGMRIDYFLPSAALASRVAEVKVFGSGADREGFLGSDHCPVMLTLRATDEKGAGDI